MKLKKFFALLCLALFAPCLTFVGCGEGKDAKTYNFVLTNATIPPVMATLDLIGGENQTYFWYGRKQTFTDSSKLGFDVMGKEISPSTGISSKVLDEMSNKVLDLYMKNKNNKFNLYVTDYAANAALKMFVAQRIPQANWNVKLLEDGTKSYYNFSSIYGGETGYEVFTQDRENLASTIKSIQNGNIDYSFSPLSDTDGYKLAFSLATYDNVEYYLQYPEYMRSKSEDMTSHVQEINFKKFNLTDKYKSLSAENQNKFKSAVFDLNYIDPIIKQNNGKKTLVVCGTSLNGEEFISADQLDADTELKNGNKQQKFESFFNQIMKDYPEYNIVIKPHPSWGLDDETTSADEKGVNWSAKQCEGAYERRVNYCKANNIKVLPGQVPMEVLIWAYGDDIKIGGYSSTLYMNAEKDMTLFFILGSSSIDSLGYPLPMLMKDGILGSSVKVYYPDGNEIGSVNHNFEVA